MLRRLFRPGPVKASSQRLYASAVAQARSPAFYRDLGVRDRIDARFELYTIHVALLTNRLYGQGEQASETAKALFSEYLSALDHTLRELGVGDLSVAKKVRPLAEALYGRTKAYGEALAGEPDRDALAGLIERTVFSDQTGEAEAATTEPGPLVDYVVRLHRALAAQDLAGLLKGEVSWPAPVAEVAA
ncbi:MAG: ubiquinol-cytochrome C reductase [Proteobacteria bacterium]|nr:ubiquinol-cytochrome C reductase [Pseudomonadota bacterium]